MSKLKTINFTNGSSILYDPDPKEGARSLGMHHLRMLTDEEYNALVKEGIMKPRSLGWSHLMSNKMIDMLRARKYLQKQDRITAQTIPLKVNYELPRSLS